MAVWRSTTYYEAQGSPEEGYKIDESGARRKTYIPDSLAARRQAAADFCGYSWLSTNGTVSWINRVTPHPYPTPSAPPELLSGGFTPIYRQALYATSIERTQPLGITEAELVAIIGGTDLIGQAQRFAEMRLHYQCMAFPGVLPDSAVLAQNPGGAPGTDNPLWNAPGGPYPDEGGAIARGYPGSRYVRRSIKPGGRILPARSGVFKYVSDAVAFPEVLNVNEPMIDVQYYWYWVPLDAYPNVAILNGEGCVNGLEFDGFPPGTLMFLNTATEEHTDALGQFVLVVVHHFRGLARFRRNGPDAGTPLGWNGQPRWYADGTFDYELVSSDGSLDLNKRPFQSYDFSRLFRPDQPYAQTWMS